MQKKQHILDLMESNGLLPLFFHNDIDKAKAIVQSCINAGANTIEFVDRGEGALEVFKALKDAFHLQLEVFIGVGSIRNAAHAKQFIDAGADFIVSPVCKKEIAQICNQHDTLYIPGCGTVTEISNAEEWGATLVKLFPANVYGPAFIKAVKGPQPWTKIMPTGGVTTEESNLREWFDAGATCVGLGSKLIDLNTPIEKLENKIKTTLRSISKIRN